MSSAKSPTISYRSGIRRAISLVNTIIIRGTKRRVGRWGERVATRHVEKARLAPLRQNWRAGTIEADIIALDKRTLTVIEVKTRHESLQKDYPALSAVNRDKRIHLHRLARRFLRNYAPLCRRYGVKGYRVDVIEVYYKRTRFGLRRVTQLHWHKGMSEVIPRYEKSSPF